MVSINPPQFASWGDTHRSPDEVALVERMEYIGIQWVANVLHPIRTVLCNHRAPKWLWKMCFTSRRHDTPIPVGNAEDGRCLLVLRLFRCVQE